MILVIAEKPSVGAAIGKVLDNEARRVTIHLPYDKGGLLDKLYLEAKVEEITLQKLDAIKGVCRVRVVK